MDTSERTTRRVNWSGVILWAVILGAVFLLARGCLTTVEEGRSAPCPTQEVAAGDVWGSFMYGLKYGSRCP